MGQRICAQCRNPDLLDYGVTDAFWEQVVPERLQPEIVCLICFDKMAQRRGVEWTGELVYVKFVGQAGTFTHRP